MNSLLPVVLILAPILALVGCASVPLADASTDAAAKRFAPPPDKSAIYLFRDEFIGATVSVPVALDGQTMGETGPQTYFLWLVEPGAHRVSSHAGEASSVGLYTEPGRNYFIWQEMTIGLLEPGTRLHIVGADRGRQGVRGARRVEGQF